MTKADDLAGQSGRSATRPWRDHSAIRPIGPEADLHSPRSRPFWTT